MTRKILFAATALCALGFAANANAAPEGVKVGVLTCQVESGWGYVLGSSKNIDCDYHPNQGENDRYVGSMSKLGVDIGYTDHGVIVWDVVAPTSDTRPGALQGGYAGATASATVGAGVGANVMLGGFDKSIALQPVSVEGNTGLDVSAGIGAMRLRVPPKPVIVQVAEAAPAPVAEPVRGEEHEAQPMHPVVHHYRHHRHVRHCTCVNK